MRIFKLIIIVSFLVVLTLSLILAATKYTNNSFYIPIQGCTYDEKRKYVECKLYKSTIKIRGINYKTDYVRFSDYNKGEVFNFEIDNPIKIQGIPCENEINFYMNEQLYGCYLSKDHLVDGLLCRGDGGDYGCFDYIGFYKSGKLSNCYLTKPTIIKGIPCKANYVTLYENRQIAECWLSKPITIQGVPCKADYAVFHENGKVKRCYMEKDITIDSVNYKKGDFLIFDDKGNVKKKMTF